MKKIIYLNKSKYSGLNEKAGRNDKIFEMKYGLAVSISYSPKEEGKPPKSSLEALLREIEKKTIEKLAPPKSSPLESKTENNVLRPKFSKYPPVYAPLENSPHINPKSGAQVFYVPQSYMPKVSGGKVLGLYDPTTHSIYISNDLTPKEVEFVYLHEEAHSLGIHDEDAADNYAAIRTGFNLRRRTA